MRRSSSTSVDSRCGIRPSVAPNTTTRSHSRPLTRWIVDRVTPPSARSRWNVRRSQASNDAGVGVEVGHLQQRLEVVEVRAARATGAVEQGHGRAEADVVAHRREQVARGGAACGRARPAGRGRRPGRRASGRPWRRRCGRRPAGRRPPTGSGRATWSPTAAGPRLGRRCTSPRSAPLTWSGSAAMRR